VLFRGRWLVGHVLVVAVVAAFVALGLWQLGRHRDEQAARRDARAAFAAPAPDLVTVADAAASDMRVTVAGEYDAAGEVLLRNRVRGGDGGYDVLTPMRLADGTAVLVDRGWVSRRAVRGGLDGMRPPAGEVVVRGTLHESRPLRSGDTVDERAGLPALPRVDVGVAAERVGYELRDVWITAQWQDPAPGDSDPRLPDPPDDDPVNHLSYAFQWFGLALVPLVGWPVVLRRRALTRSGRRDEPARRADAGTPRSRTRPGPRRSSAQVPR
jgi:cytochrome oxidase assembly protein ShyY1